MFEKAPRTIGSPRGAVVYGPIQIEPLRFDRDVGQIDPPRGSDGSLELAPAFLEHRGRIE